MPTQDDNNEPLDGQDRLLNALYRDFIDHGGFSQPCISEDVERRARNTPAHRPTICPHGKSMLMCDICYFNKDSGGWTR